MKRKPKQKDRLKPLSLYPLKPAQALSAFMEIDPRKIKMAEEKAKRKKRNKGG